jgi:outer membrane protein
MVSRSALAAGMVFALLAGTAHAQPRTLQDALAAAYSNNPTLQTSRAQLRATDEGVPAALAGWRPQVTFTGTAGIGAGKSNQFSDVSNGFGVATRQEISGSADRGITSATLSVTQPVYRGGKTRASTNRAENQVLSTRAQLLATEQTVFTDTVNAYVTVIQDEQILQLDISNEQVLTKQLQSTNDRFRVGELTRTDVAQAEAALASASATRQTAEGSLQAARASYEQLVGEAPGKLKEPQPLQTPVKTLEEAKAQAAHNNPNVVAALFADSAARDAFDVAYSALMPNLSVQASAFRNENQLGPGQIQTGGQILASLTVPIFQGGAEYAGIRQARQQEIQARKQLEDQRRTAVQQATSAWEQLVSARASIMSDRSAIRANQIALEGVEREALVGSRTTLDVLTAQQTLLTSETTLVQALAQLVTASYQVAAASGRLNARDLNLQVPLYDEKAYYNAVKNLWVGTGDYATDQPGR